MLVVWVFTRLRRCQLLRGVLMFKSVGIQGAYGYYGSPDAASSQCLISCPLSPVLLQGAQGHLILRTLHPG